uniref:VHS domain-containing protein n=1 Tax=Strongyloides papillosus TaxID=174720 RepID=A0A0N5BPX0_STREA
MYDETKIYHELNKLWWKYPYILKYNDKEVRQLIVKTLVEKDVEDKKVCPHLVLEILIKNKEMVKMVNKKIFFQAALQVKKLCLTYLHYLGGDNIEGKKFRRKLCNFIENNCGPFFIYDEQQELSERNEEVSRCIKVVLSKVGVSRSRLHQIDESEIASNFSEFKRIHAN